MASDFAVSLRIISSITAWTTIRTKQEIQKTIPETSEFESPVILTDNEKEFVREYVEEGENDEDKKERRIEMAEMLDIGLQRIAGITAHTKRRLNKAMTATEVLAPVDITNKKKSNEVSLKGGEHVEYNNEIKNKWRQKMEDFIKEHTDLEDRKNMKVLCLPGKKCLEIPMYLEMGFLAENIVGVEGGDKAAKEEFTLSAKKLGIDYRIGRLEDILPDEKTVFDVVSLDFVGPMGKNNLKIIEKVLLNEESILLVNLLKKREKKYIQELCRISYNGLKICNNKSNTIAEELSKRDANAEANRNSSENHISNTRSLGVLMILQQQLGMDRKENLLIPEFYNAIEQMAKVPDIGIKFAFEVLARIIPEICDDLTKLTAPFIKDYEKANIYSLLMYTLVRDTFDKRSNFNDVKKYEYKSRVGKKASVFTSYFCKVDRPDDFYESSKNVVAFFLNIILFLYYVGNSGYFEAINKKGNPVKDLGKRGARIVYRDKKTDEIISSIRVDKLASITEKNNTLAQKCKVHQIAIKEIDEIETEIIE